MFNRIQARKLDDLVAALSAELQKNASGENVLLPSKIIVPNMDMARRVQVELAKKDGISANLEFELPAAFFKKLAEHRFPEIREWLPGKNELQWMIFAVLSDVLSPGYPSTTDLVWKPLLNWIQRFQENDVNPNESEIRAIWNLSISVTDTFDQYLLYRPDWLMSWSGLKTTSDLTTTDQKWQMHLWHEISQKWPDIPNRAKYMVHFRDEVISATSKESGTTDLFSGETRENLAQNWNIPQNVYVFGVTSAPPPVVENLVLLGKLCRVHWFERTNELAGDSHQNDLFFDSLQHQQRELSSYLSELTGHFNVPETLKQAPDTLDSKVKSDNSSESLLNKIKHRFRDSSSQISVKTDDSLQIHVCHSPRREVEVLRDRLLYLFENYDIRPGEIAVVCPDPAAYMPFIAEVFSGADVNVPTIPFRVSGLHKSHSQEGAEIFLEALHLGTSRFKLTEILDWLERGPILGDYADAQNMRNLLHQWVNDQRIRWAQNSEHLNELEFNMSGRFSWEHGIDRLMLSWLTTEDEEVVFNNIPSGNPVTGQETVYFLGRLSAIITQIGRLRTLSNEQYKLSEWAAHLADICNEMLSEPFANADYHKRIHTALQALSDVEQKGIFTGKANYSLVSEWLNQALQPGGLGRSWNAGQVTCTGMVPLHQMPFKVVAILGLNEGVFPGRNIVSPLDLIPKSPRPGDRNKRESDRQMFLDYLHQTREFLHLSYVGMRQTDNKPMAPSVLLTMFTDFLRRAAGSSDILHKIIKYHALQPFNRIYFSEDAPISYSQLNLKLANQIAKGGKLRKGIVAEKTKELLSDVTRVEPINLAEILSFYKNPIRYYLKNKLGLRLDEYDLPDEDSEPIELSHLEKWKIRDAVIGDWTKTSRNPAKFGEMLSSFKEKAILQGVLPDEPVASSIIADLDEEFKSIASLLKPFTKELEVSSDQELEFFAEVSPEVHQQILARFDIVSDEHHFILYPGSQKPSSDFGAWIQHLALNTSHSCKTIVVYGNHKCILFEKMSQNEANERFADILKVFEEGQSQPIPFLYSCAEKYLNSAKKIETESEAREILIDLAEEADNDSNNNSQYQSYHIKELNDIWVKTAYSDESPLISASAKQRFYLPNQAQKGTESKADNTSEPDNNKQSISDDDLEKGNLFTLCAVKLFDRMLSEIVEAKNG